MHHAEAWPEEEQPGRSRGFYCADFVTLRDGTHDYNNYRLVM
jgi:hypothetical protein